MRWHQCKHIFMNLSRVFNTYKTSSSIWDDPHTSYSQLKILNHRGNIAPVHLSTHSKHLLPQTPNFPIKLILIYLLIISNSNSLITLLAFLLPPSWNILLLAFSDNSTSFISTFLEVPCHSHWLSGVWYLRAQANILF